MMTEKGQLKSDLLRGLALTGMAIAAIGIVGSWFMWIGAHDMSKREIINRGLTGSILWSLVFTVFAFMRSRVRSKGITDGKEPAQRGTGG